MNILKFALPMFLILPISVGVTQTAQAQQRQQQSRTEAACNATARFSICQGYHQIFCQYYGLQDACKLVNLSQSNPEYYQQLITANKICIEGNAQACNWLKQQRF